VHYLIAALLALALSTPRDYLASIQPSPELQAFLERAIGARLAADPALRRADLRVALLDLTHEPTRLAQHHGETPIYPASVVKFVYLRHRIAGGAARLPGLQVYAKSGTWGPIYADAGIVRDAAGRQFALAVFTAGSPPYRGDVIAALTYEAARHMLGPRLAAP
jgi:D-alanyl-D-alanine carboxypeptidase